MREAREMGVDFLYCTLTTIQIQIFLEIIGIDSFTLFMHLCWYIIQFIVRSVALQRYVPVAGASIQSRRWYELERWFSTPQPHSQM